MTEKVYPEAIAHYPRAAQIIIKKLHNRVFIKNKNALIIVVGETGSGKSYDSLGLLVGLYLYRFGKLDDDEYYIDHCKFRALDFMRAMNKEFLPRGDAWIWDESGIDAGSKEHATIKNKVISWYAQTCRNQHQIIFFTVPTLSMIDPNVRKLLHYYFEAVFVDEVKCMGVIKPLKMQYNTRMDKIYYHRLSIITPEGVEEVEMAGIPLMHKTLIDLYEKKKKQFTTDLNMEITQILEMIEHKKLSQFNVRLTDEQEDVYITFHKLKQELGRKPLCKEVADKLGITAGACSCRMRTLKRRLPAWKNNPELLKNQVFSKDSSENGSENATPELNLQSLPAL